MVVLISMVCAACSTKNTNGQGNGDDIKPKPQVRVGALPSDTPSAPVQVDVAAPTPEASPSATAAQLYYDPTPDEDAIVNQVQSLIDDIDRGLKSANFNLK